MKKIYMIVSIIAAIILLLIFINALNNTQNAVVSNSSSQQNESSGNMEDYSTDANTIDASKMDDNITMTFDSGCQETSDYYIERENYPDTPVKQAMLSMQEKKCFAQKITDKVYASPVDYIAVSGSEIIDETPVYAYVYVYGSNIDYQNDIYIQKKDGTKIYPSQDSVINDGEGYLFFDVPALQDIEDVKIGGDLNYSLLEIENQKNECVGTKCGI